MNSELRLALVIIIALLVFIAVGIYRTHEDQTKDRQKRERAEMMAELKKREDAANESREYTKRNWERIRELEAINKGAR